MECWPNPAISASRRRPRASWTAISNCLTWGSPEVKGASQPLHLYDLVGVGSFRTRLDQSRARGLSAFVGRSPEMAILEKALERAQTGGQVVGIMAEPGAGKSRLCAEFIERCRSQGFVLLEARGVPHGKSIPMLPMLELWRNFFGITESDTAEKRAAKISSVPAGDEPGVPRRSADVCLSSSAWPRRMPPPPALDPEQRQKRIHAVVKRVMHDPSVQRGGIRRVVLLEDLHWFDGASDAFLDTIVDCMPATRDLLVVNFRPVPGALDPPAVLPASGAAPLDPDAVYRPAARSSRQPSQRDRARRDGPGPYQR